MKFILDFFPAFLFFISFKIWGIYTSIAVLMASSFAQIAFIWFRYQKIEPSHLIAFFIVLILGGASLLFRNPIFLLWKPTIVFWTFAIIFIVYKKLKKKTVLASMIGPKLALPESKWNFLNKIWLIFFLAVGAINIYVAYNFTLNAWVNFKVFGVLALTIIFIVLQSFYISKNAIEGEIK
jgi:intracellular septation protein